MDAMRDDLNTDELIPLLKKALEILKKPKMSSKKEPNKI
jgi:hypothetical protein